MAVLEITLLRIKYASLTRSPNHPPTSTVNDALAALRDARTALATRVYNTHSRFFHAVYDRSLVYIFGVWPSVERHLAFLASKEKDEILGGQEDMFEFLWGRHIVLGDGEGEGDGEDVGEDVMRRFVPINAPVLCLGRFEMLGTTTPGDDGAIAVSAKEKFTSIWTEYSSLIIEATEPYPLCAAWSVEGGDVDVTPGSAEGTDGGREQKKTDEWIAITGWKDKITHGEFRAESKIRFPELLGLKELYRREEVRSLIDMEG